MGHSFLPKPVDITAAWSEPYPAYSIATTARGLCGFEDILQMLIMHEID